MPGDQVERIDAGSWLAARNRWTRRLAEAAATGDVAATLADLVAVVEASQAVVLRPSWQEGVLRGHLAVGGPDSDVQHVVVSTDLSEPRRLSARSTLALEGRGRVPTLFVRMGPHSAGWVLALVYPDGVPLDGPRTELVQAVASEAWAALRRLELVAELEASVSESRNVAENVAGLTHDLRTPLTGLLGFIRTMQHAGDSLEPEASREYLDIMERQAVRLAGLVTDLLTDARIEAGELRPDLREPVDVGALVDESLLVFGGPGRDRVVVDVEPSLTVLGDRAQLLRVVQNLVDNALKYAPAPTPVRVEGGRDGAFVEICVVDGGPGIPADQVPRLFQRFSRGEGGRPDSTGLGLSIVKGIVDAHGGTVATEPDRDAGTMFVVRLPAG